MRYHKDGVASPSQMVSLLQAELGKSLRYFILFCFVTAINCLFISESSIKRRRLDLGLHSARSGVQKRLLSYQDKTQIVLNQLKKDPSKGQGLSNIKNHIAHDQGIHLSRDDISHIMHTHDPEGFRTREPGAKKIPRTARNPVGIHERWAGDGHDKLYKIGFPIWAVVDDASAKWLNIIEWVTSLSIYSCVSFLNTRVSFYIIVLTLVLRTEDILGIPLQFSTDCGSETTQLYGLVNALREIFFSDCDIAVVRAYEYLRSIHNVAIEQSWLRLRVDFGDNAVIEYQKGPPFVNFDAEDPLHLQLSQWLWSKTLQLELNNFMAISNAKKMRKDSTKPGPSGASRNQNFALHAEFGLTNELLRLNDGQLAIVSELKDAIGGEALIAFATPEFSARAEEAYSSLGVKDLSIQNAWHVFETLLPLLAVE
ncbi:hypothetical protein CVT25_007551 [Psilocybe cyanescens]|uniref:Integrase catalytic domain-containing protein n=1 Tax=Psilocybe cyanescens TaxID=93625 RepID=A0A409WW11_PSICY|nr:hypothetical protein CVT25_007551 [Psilocybe cyanescens]